MIHFVLLVSKQGKIRLEKYYTMFSEQQRQIIKNDLPSILMERVRTRQTCSVVEYKEYRVVYRRYASLFFLFGIDEEDNELLVLETIQSLVELIDKYFVNACELDLMFHFQKAYYILDELIVNGRVSESSQKAILNAMSKGDDVENSKLSQT